jgi:stearoyl-CoA desaturase (delta-9 desaturase)
MSVPRPARAPAPPHAGPAHPIRFMRLVAGMVVVVPLAATLFAAGLVLRRGLSGAEAALLAVSYTVTMLGITVGFHRHFTHGAFKTGRRMRMLLAIVGSMAMQGPLVWWVATHRLHHRLSDRPGDPHSPNLEAGSGGVRLLRGFVHSHIGWMFHMHSQDWVRLAPDLLRDRDAMWVHRYYFAWVALGLVIPAFLGWTWTGTVEGAGLGLLWGGLVRMCLVDHAAWCVGSLSHMFGTRPFTTLTRDRSANNHLVAVLAFGEGLQNNHHAFPSSAAHALRWWEPDFSHVVIVLLEKLSWVRDVKRPSREQVEAARQACVAPPLREENAFEAGSGGVAGRHDRG